MEGNFLIGETTTIIITIIMMEMFFCRLLRLRILLIFQTKQDSDRFQTLEVFLNDNVNNFPPPPPPPPPLPPFQSFFQPPPLPRAPDVTFRRKNDAATYTTQMMSGDRLIGELERVIEKGKTKGKPNA